MVLVNFYTNDCSSCDDLGPTYEAIGEIVTDTAMSLVDELNLQQDYSEDEYEKRVNEMAPVLVTKLDCSDYPDVCNEQKVRAYPTMRLYLDGLAKGDYNGHRTVMEIVNWLSEMEAKFQASDKTRMQSVVECK
jgi:thioredoxin-like negative regulator of GroEL